MDSIAGDVAKNSAWIIAALALFFEITPIKINPLSMLFGWLGKMINRDVLNQINSLKSEVNAINERVDETNKRIDSSNETQDIRYAIQCRTRILRCGGEVMVDPIRTREYYSQVLEDIDTYERYCKDHPEFPNNQAIATIALIKQRYQECLSNNGFLVLV